MENLILILMIGHLEFGGTFPFWHTFTSGGKLEGKAVRIIIIIIIIMLRIIMIILMIIMIFLRILMIFNLSR